MKKPTKPLSIVLLLISFAMCQAQPKYLAKFRKVSLDELKMENYEADANAPAVILFDKGHFNGTNGQFIRHVRLKILTAAGTSFANFTIRTPTKSLIDGSTFNLVDGQIQETKVSNDNIFREEVIEDFEMFKVFFPNVKPGSVIDLRYSFGGLPYRWRFQDRIPVMYSEITLEPTRYISFKKAMYGSVPVKSVDNMRWVAEKVPAFYEEPYMTHYSNYLGHFKFDLESIFFPGFYKEFSSTWEKIAERLWESPSFGGVVKHSPFLNDKGKELKASAVSKSEKINQAFTYIQENIKWNGYEAATASADFWKNFSKNHSGNSAEVNLLLTALLKKAGINAYPVLMSTRDNGLLNPVSASMSSVNYVACYVRDGDVEMILDATSPYVIPGVLPTRCLNTSAYVVDSPTGWWIDIAGARSNSRRQYIKIILDKTGEISGDITNTYEDYDYLQWIEKYNELGSDEAYADALKARSTDFAVTACSLAIDKLKLRATETIRASLTGSAYAQDLGSELIINPFLFNDIENPFKAETRMYPIDFVSRQKRTAVISMTIPDEFTLMSVPENFNLRPENGGAKFLFQTALVNNVLTIKCELSIEKQVFLESEYPALRNFFSEVNRKLGEAVQLKKKT